MRYPEIVDEDTWITARRRLLDEEKDLTKRIDAVNAARRRLPIGCGFGEYLGAAATVARKGRAAPRSFSN